MRTGISQPVMMLLALSVLAALPACAMKGSAMDQAAEAANSPRQVVNLDADWKFTKGDPAGAPDLSYGAIKNYLLPLSAKFLKDPSKVAAAPTAPLAVPQYAAAGFKDDQWRTLSLPHDWGVEGPFGAQGTEGATGRLPFWGVGWYRKQITIPASDAGKEFFLDVDGAMSYATVWVNGEFVGGWPYGYASWRVDLTKQLKAGQANTVAIRVDNPNQSSRWYPGGGIYRSVWLTKTSPVHVGQWGTYVTTPAVSATSATVKIKTTVDNDSPSAANLSVTTELYVADKAGKPAGAAVASVTTDGVAVEQAKSGNVEQSITLPTPKLWSVETPNRYVAVSVVKAGGNLLDRYETPFGVRTIEYSADKGFLLNGKVVDFNGVCNHHDLGALGAAVNVRALERQLEILKEMGCNAIRTSHNPPTPELVELCDRMGFLVMCESFDTWRGRKRPNDYHLLFPEWHEQDLRAIVRHYRNSPAIALWSIGNEIGEQGSPEGAQLSKSLTEIVHEEDPTRDSTAACNNAQAAFNGFNKTIDAFGFNYKPMNYERFHKETPGQFFYSSESASTISSRGEYLFPVTEPKGGGLIVTKDAEGKAVDWQMSSYDLYAPRWATTPDAEFAGQDKTPATGGEFVWTGFDYLGEPTPWGGAADKARSSYFGIIDLAGFKKDRFYLYQARWNPTHPMAHILPHWNWPDRVGQVTPVHVYTSGDEAELFINGKSQGRKKKGEFEYRLRWDEVKYEPGEVKVVAYKNGKEWATDVVKTTGAAAKLGLTPDRATIAADGKDLSFVTLSVQDANGLTVPQTKNEIMFEVSGPGELVATDNGDAVDWTVFASPKRKAFNGLALAIVRAKPGQTGAITVTAKADGLTAATTTLHAK